jgi:hypothetical protein
MYIYAHRGVHAISIYYRFFVLSASVGGWVLNIKLLFGGGGGGGGGSGVKFK